ncbi:hypothetical protein KJ673_04105, partial [Patescibacteria group bacterium]|nr:hypothetical protein [Patescibacteria group bacterium]
ISQVISITKKNCLEEADIKRLELIARNLVQSPSSILLTALNGLQSNITTASFYKNNLTGSIDKQTVEKIKQVISKLSDQDISFETSLEGAITAVRMICANRGNQVLILVPRQRDTEIFSSFLSTKHALLHGHTKTAQRKWILNSWKNGSLKILIGTKQASLLPANKIDKIVIFDPDSIDHCNYSRNPRFDARLCAKLLAKQHNAKILFIGPLSCVGQSEIRSISDQSIKPSLIDLKDADEKTQTLFISHSLQNAIQDSLQNSKSVLLSYNAKGVAKRIQCKSCAHIPLCGTCGAQPYVRINDLVCPICQTEMWIPQVCPACGKKTLSSRGIGNKRIAHDLAKLFPQAKIGIIDKEHQKNIEADIILATEYYFQSVYWPFPTKRFGLVAEIMADKTFGNDYASATTTAQRLHRLIKLASAHKAQCLIQTWSKELIKPMLDGQKFIGSERLVRSKYQLPPFVDEFEIAGDVNEVVQDLETHGHLIKNDNSTTLLSDPANRNKIFAILNNLPNNVTIQTTFESYEA